MVEAVALGLLVEAPAVEPVQALGEVRQEQLVSLMVVLVVLVAITIVAVVLEFYPLISHVALVLAVVLAVASCCFGKEEK